uniref:Protein translocase subunit SecY n=1 Tax=Astrosyne radiata TaxID=1158023 RepID=A0A2U9NU16_9STRA|nr:preprotein translocase subunit SecY [Astrosyne radiata]AWT40366.1 preprotein translocase subunit SecY [Astrosyne radiata]
MGKIKIVKVVNPRILKTILTRSIISVVIIIIIRLGGFIPIPDINHLDLAVFLKTNLFAKNILRGLPIKNTYVISFLTLNIFPYINATILIQVYIAFSPAFSKMQKEGDLEAKRVLNRLTRFLTITLAIIQSFTICYFLRKALFDLTVILTLYISIWLTTGTMITLWLTEIINDYGLGNGASLLIYINIVSNFPNIYRAVMVRNSILVTKSSILTIILSFHFILFGVILLQEGSKNIPLISSFQLNLLEKKKFFKPTVSTYLPIRLNQAGIMPIILTTTILVFPQYLFNLVQSPINTPLNSSIFFKLVYWLIYFMFITFFSSFYSQIILNPKDISDQLQKSAVTIPGVRVGLETIYYLKINYNRISRLGSLMLAFLTTLPNFIETTLNISSLTGLSTTSLLIIVGVTVEIAKEIDEIIYSNIYKV